MQRLNERLYGQRPVPYQEAVLAAVAGAREVLIFGAGRGARELDLRSPGRRIVGVDLTEDVLTNPWIDEAYVYDGRALPFADASFDLCTARWVVEHLDDPAAAFREIRRVLRPGGRFVFMTSNRWYFIYLASSMIPNRWHPALVRRLTGRAEQDTFPTRYRANTRRRLRLLLTAAGFREERLTVVQRHVPYLQFSLPTFLIGVAYERLVNLSSLLQDLRQSIVGTFVASDRPAGVANSR